MLTGGLDMLNREGSFKEMFRNPAGQSSPGEAPGADLRTDGLLFVKNKGSDAVLGEVLGAGKTCRTGPDNDCLVMHGAGLHADDGETYRAVSAALRYSRFNRAILLIEIPFGQTASHSLAFEQ